MRNFASEAEIDYHEIWKRGGANAGNEKYALFQCPSCRTTYLIDYEVDTVFLDANDLAKRSGIPGNGDKFTCLGCGRLLDAQSIWKALRTEDGTEDWQVTRDSLRSSPWAWTVKPNTREQ